jgi:pimeloyl-ACP methyl ester carboxylesterase
MTRQLFASAVMSIAAFFYVQVDPAFAQTPAPEIWFGELDVKVAKLRLEFRVTKGTDGVYQGSMFSLDQGNAEIKLDEFTFADGQLRITSKRIAAGYSGKLNATVDESIGTWTQAGNKTPLTLKRVEAVPSRKHIESWLGTLKTPEKKFDFQVRIFENAVKTRSAVLDSFDESAVGLNIEFYGSGEDFNFTVPVSNGKFEGKRKPDSDRIEGKWIQAGRDFELSFDKVELEKTRALDLNRPQTPKAPFPYEIVEVTIPADNGKIMLSATLTKPKGVGRHPVVVLISGSGPQDRDETILSHKPFWVIADHLSRLGIAVLRYDERGVAKSTGEYATATTSDFALDVESIVDFLKKHESIDASKIGLIGHSEGGIVAPMVAARRNDIAAIVMLAGPGVPGKQIVLNQSRRIAAASGVQPALLDAQEELLKGIFAATPEQIKQSEFMDQLVKEFQAKLPKDDPTNDLIVETTKAGLKTIDSPWFELFLIHDPGLDLAKLKTPVLVMNGEKDLQVDPDLNIPVIERILKTSGNKDFKIVRLENLNHLFQNCQTGEPEEYLSISETFAPVALKTMSDWLLERLK